MMDIGGILAGITVWILPALLAITLHEAAHGYAALLLGDDTAKRLGRVTLNPLRHIDPFGTVLLPLMLFLLSGSMFGWAKPVPVDFARLRDPRWGSVLVAAAGPAVNLALFLVSLAAFQILPWVPDVVRGWLSANLGNFLLINLVLFVFNLFPVPPLDGGRIMVGILPRDLALPLARLEPYGMFIVLFLLFLLPWAGRQVGLDLDLFSWALRAVLGVFLPDVADNAPS